MELSALVPAELPNKGWASPEMGIGPAGVQLSWKDD